uniref:F-box/WD repeat-containing protein 7-like n=1 Tax=Styela clava TaxID=7725 RepID=UPI0019396BE7|nr:F-box/WD repeat-containing protein 7-like [Styela clava]
MESSSEQMEKIIDAFTDLTTGDQNKVLKQILRKCKRKQLQLVYNELQPLLAIDFVTFLPRELIELIFSFLSPKELGRVSVCSKQWREHSNNSKLWKLLCKKSHWMHFGDETGSGDLYAAPSSSAPPQSPLTSPSFHFVPHTCTELPPVCRWKDVYVRAHHLQNNWETGRYTVYPPLRGHKERITCLHCSGKYLATGSDDRSAIVWDLLSYSSVHVLKHPDSVLALKIKNNLLVTGCADGIVRIFNLSTGKCLGQLKGHTSSVHCICFDGNRIISGSQDRTIRVWNATSGRSLYTLEGHVDDLVSLCCHGNMLVSTSWDESARIWNVDSGVCTQVLLGHSEVVHCCHFDSTHVVTGGGDKVVKVWLVETGQLTNTLTGHTDDVYCVSFNDEVICSGSADSSVRVWSWSGGSLYNLRGHIGVVRCLYLKHNTLITAGDQMKVIVWDPSRGKLLNIVHRNPSLVNLMWVTSTRLIVAGPEGPGAATVLSFW